MTARGVILGTAAYMSPEQARGKPVDKRSDIWAFGCVLYEMLTGKRAFEGEDVSDTLAAILRGEPDWSALPKALPPPVDAVLRSCLEKDRKKRLPDISLARFVLENPSAHSWVGQAPVAPPALQRSSRALVPWTLAALLGLGFAGMLVYAYMAPRWNTSPAGPLRFNSDVGAEATLDVTTGPATVISPDGRTVAFVASTNLTNPPELYVRRLDQLQASLIPGTQRSQNPFFSPDGQWIGFFSQGKLKKVAVAGGAPVTLCDAPSGRGASWGDDGFIVFSPSSAPQTPLMRVTSDGGVPTKLFDLAKDEGSQRWPQVLPGSKAVLYSSLRSGTGNWESANIVVRALSGDRRVVLQQGGYFGRYVSSRHLLYMHQGTIFGVPFDPDRLELAGSPVPVVQGVTGGPNSGGAQLAVSANGTAVYMPGEGQGSVASIQWLDQTGKLSALRSVGADWSNPAFSPDGRSLAMDISDGTQTDVWVYDIVRDTLTKLTFDPADDARPVWSPDGSRIAFASRRGDKATFNVYWLRADGTGDVQRLTESTLNQQPTSFHWSGKYLAYFESGAPTATDLKLLTIEGSERTGWKPSAQTVLLQTPLVESMALFSPDGKWYAYLSNESGENQVFVRPFVPPGTATDGAAPTGKWQISTSAADDPSWSHVRHELFFLSGSDLRMMVASYTGENGAFKVDKPRVWSDTRVIPRPRPPSRDLDLHPDGKRFAVASNQNDTTVKQNKAVFVFNFFDELRRIAPVK
jgi:serine/threonine-protein kinase